MRWWRAPAPPACCSRCCRPWRWRTSRRCATLAHQQGFAYALGIHPLFTDRAADDDLARLDEALAAARGDPRLVAVGEIGLDHFVPGLDRARQERFYVEQLKLARRHGLPVILHVRRSADGLLKQLRRIEVVGGIAHAFNGSAQQALSFVGLGFKLGFGGAATFERALQIRELARSLPLEAIVHRDRCAGHSAALAVPHRRAARRRRGVAQRAGRAAAHRRRAGRTARHGGGGIRAGHDGQCEDGAAGPGWPRHDRAHGELLHGLPPVIGRDTRLVVLGSFPSVASLQAGQYYAHPRNQFWPLLSALWGVDLVGMPYRSRLAEVKRRGLGIWDVYASCRREGSLDSAIESAVPNDLAGLRRRAPRLQAVAHNGGESARAMSVTRTLGIEVLRLPSTSPANAGWSFERKLAAWRAAFAAHGLA